MMQREVEVMKVRMRQSAYICRNDDYNNLYVRLCGSCDVLLLDSQLDEDALLVISKICLKEN